METGECLQFVQGPGLVEGLRVEFDGGVGAINPRAPAVAFLGWLGMGGAVSAQEEAGMAAGSRRHQGLAMPFAL